MLFKSFVAALVAAAVANAQTIVTSSASSVAATTTASQAMPAVATAGFNAAAVNTTVRQQWCRGQLDNCPQICGGAAAVNQCLETTLTYTCVCPNGTAPDVTSFAETLPFFICQQTFIQCMANNPNNLAGQTQCQENEQCGTRNATAEAIAASSASAATTASSTSGSSSRTGSASATGSSASSTANVAALSSEVTTGAFVAVLMAAFKLLL